MVWKIILNMFKHLFRRGKGLFKLLFVIDDFFRIFTMTLLIPIFFGWLGFGNYLITLGAILGLVIDVHDFMVEAKIVRIK